MGVTRLVFTSIGAVIIDRVGRRSLLLLTVITCSITLASAGASLLFKIGSVSSIISLISVLIFVAAYGIGVGPVPWILLGELLPSPIRSLGASIITSWFSMTVFTISNIFPDLLAIIGYEGGFLIFSLSNIIFALIIFKWLPETRGKTLLELENTFNNKKLKHSVV